MDRKRLYEIVDRRVDTMLANGWLNEVRWLLSLGVTFSSPPMSSSGYRELGAALRGELSMDEAIERAKFSVHAYIRRQYIWLRRQVGFEWIEVAPGYESGVLDRVERYLQNLEQELKGASADLTTPDCN
jgi:tRNA dimethylallyltransferase